MLDSSIKFGQNYLHLHEVESTNLYASDFIAKTYPIEGTVIRADFQTGGRGQIGRTWYSSSGKNLLCSIIIYPTFLLAKHQFLLSKLTSVTLVTLLVKMGIQDVRIKWPNDIYVGDKKIAGILIQNQLMGKRVKNSIIGIGLNINQERWPSELPNPVSIKEITNQTFDAERLMFDCLELLEANYRRLIFQGLDQIEEDYLRNLYLKGIKHTFYKNEEPFEGIIQGVDESGRLVVLVDNTLSTFAFREISFRKS